jgi:hypothetical protein
LTIRTSCFITEEDFPESVLWFSFTALHVPLVETTHVYCQTLKNDNYTVDPVRSSNEHVVREDLSNQREGQPRSRFSPPHSEHRRHTRIREIRLLIAAASYVDWLNSKGLIFYVLFDDCLLWFRLLNNISKSITNRTIQRCRCLHYTV